MHFNQIIMLLGTVQHTLEGSSCFIVIGEPGAEKGAILYDRHPRKYRAIMAILVKIAQNRRLFSGVSMVQAI